MAKAEEEDLLNVAARAEASLRLALSFIGMQLLTEPDPLKTLETLRNGALSVTPSADTGVFATKVSQQMDHLLNQLERFALTLKGKD